MPNHSEQTSCSSENIQNVFSNYSIMYQLLWTICAKKVIGKHVVYVLKSIISRKTMSIRLLVKKSTTNNDFSFQGLHESERNNALETGEDIFLSTLRTESSLLHAQVCTNSTFNTCAKIISTRVIVTLASLEPTTSPSR